jgi:hypothetical protein
MNNSPYMGDKAAIMRHKGNTMLFKSNNDYAPDAGSGDAPEAETVAEAPPAPVSEARRRLEALIRARGDCNSARDAANASIRRLQAMQGRDAPHRAALAVLDSESGAAMRAWSATASDDPAPQPDLQKRAAIIRSIEEAVATWESAEREIPGFSADVTRATIAANEITHAINAAIAEIIREEIAPRLEEIVEIRSGLAVKLARAQLGIDLALASAEKIPLERRTTIAAAFYQNGDFEKLRVRAASPPAPSAERYAGYHDLASRLASDPSATVREG